jgi:hypothetical protein
MGQKANPVGLRLGIIKGWDSNWYGGRRFEDKLVEMGKKTKIFNACGKFNLNQSASLVKNATYVFTHDTGLMHIAAAFKRIFSVYGVIPFLCLACILIKLSLQF